MSTTETSNMAIMFADISGSTRLYEILGDEAASELVNRSLDGMIKIAKNRNGILVKTIGDEVMLRFSSATDAIEVARTIQDDVYVFSQSPRIKIRIGINFGPAIEREGDVFGDAVNLAARVTGEAKSEDILVTQSFADRLGTEYLTNLRLYDYVHVKGKTDKIAIYQFMWEEEEQNQTIMFSSLNLLGNDNAPEIMMIRYNDMERSVTSDRPMLIGRDSSCDLVVLSLHASRRHAQIMESRGKYILIDKSTNGTYVRTADGKEVYLRREQLTLFDSGIISLGEKIKDGNAHLIHFSLENDSTSVKTVINNQTFPKN